jgi:hypothetical protein
MRGLLIGAAIALAFVGAAVADTMGAIKENALVLTDASGKASAMILEADGSLIQTTAKSSTTGTWSERDGRFCFRLEGATYDQCFPAFPADKGVGDEWAVNGPTGKLMYTARIAEGRLRLDARE